MQLFDKIMAPVDFSLLSEIALNRAIGIAVKCNSTEIHLVTVNDLSAVGYLMTPETGMALSLPSINDQEILLRKKIIELGNSISKNYKIKVAGEVLPGDIVQVINDYVSSHNINLVVMATAKTAGFLEFIFGSNAQRITSRVGCPVLTMKAHTLTGSVQKIIFPVEDFYPENKLQYAIELAQLFNAEIHLLCLSEKSNSPVYNTHSIITNIVEIFEEKKIRYKAKAAEGKNITEAILQYTEIESIDLILVNPGEESKLTGRFIETTGGSIVNHTSVPVLTIKKRSTKIMKKTWIVLAGVIFWSAAIYGQGIDDGLKMIKYQRYQSAIEIFEKLYAANSNDDKAAYWQGIAEIRNKNTDTAIAHYNNSIKEPKSNLLLAGLANAYAAAGKKGDALKTLLLFDKGPDGIKDEVLASAVGRVYTELKDFTKAGLYYNRAIAINKSNPENYYLLGTNALKKGDGTAAYTALNQAISIDSNYAPAYFSLAKIFISQKAVDLYLPYLKKTIAKDSMFTPAWFELYRYAYFNEKENMKKYYTRYLQLSDKSEKQEYQLLVINFNEKKYKTVIEKAKMLLQEENSDVPVEIYKYLGFSYFQMNNLKEAYSSVIQYLEVQDSAKLKRYDFYLAAQIASRIKEKDSLALSYIINEFNADTAAANRKFYAIALVNHFIKAKDGYNTALWSEKLLPYRGINKVDLYRIGVTWYNIDELDKADSILTDFLSRYPAEYKGIYMKAGILAKKDSTMSAGLAVPYFESFIDSVHNSTEAEYKPMLEQSYNYLGGYYLKQKDYDVSLTNYSSLLKLQPANTEVKKAIADIKNYLQKVKAYEKNKNKKSN